MRIGIFTDSYVPQVNGVSVSCMNLYKGLTMLGNDVYVITTDHREKTDAKDTHIIRLEGFDVPLKNFDGFQLVPAANKYYKLIDGGGKQTFFLKDTVVIVIKSFKSFIKQIRR